MNTTFAVFVLLLPFIMVGFIVWGVNKKRREILRGVKNVSFIYYFVLIQVEKKNTVLCTKETCQ